MLPSFDVWHFALWGIWVVNIEARHYARYLNTTTSFASASTSCFKCGIEAPGGVRLIFWEPDQAAGPSNVSFIPGQVYTQVENGFTFTSPSVYVVYTSLQATQSCGVSDIITFSPSFAEKTLDYSSRFLAYGTVLNPGPNCDEYEVAGGFHTINFSDLYYTPIVTSTISKEGCPAIVNPRISLPADLTNVAPSWASCEPLFYGAWDPPSILKKASQLAPVQVGGGPVTTADGPAAATAVPAMAEAAPTPDLPQPTAVANPPQNPAQSAAAPSQADPQNAPPTPATPPTGNAANDPQKAPVSPGQPQSNPNPVDNNNQAPASAAPNEQPGPQANPNAANSNNRGPTPADNAQPQGMPYNPQEGGFDPAPVKPGQSAAAAAVAAPATPGTLQGTPSILNHPDDKTLPNNDQNAANQPVGNTPTGANHIVPNQPNGNSQAGTNQQPSQNEPAPLVVGSDGGILVDSGSHNSPAIPGAVPNNVPAAAGAAAPQPANAAAPPTISVDNNGNIYAAPVQPANNNAPPRVSVANDGKIYAAPVIGIAQHVATPAPSLSVGGKAANVGPDGALHVAGQTIARGAQGTVNGDVVSVVANNVVVGGNTQALPVAPNASPLQNTLPPSIGGQSIQIAPAGALVIGSQTITQGNKATIAGSVVSVGSNNVAVDGSIFALSGAVVPTAFAAPAPLAVAGQAIQTAPNGGIIAAGQTIAQGSQATVSGTVLSVGSSNIVLGSSTYALPANTPPAVVGQAIQPAPSGGLVVVGQTVAQGQKATISGTVVSVGSSNFVLGSSTYALPANTPPPVGGQAVQAAPNGGLVVAGQTIAQGQQATIAGTLVSIGSSNIIVGGSTYPPPGILAANPTPAGLSIGGQAIQTAPNGGLVIAGQTISQGSPATTISGTILSVGSSSIVLGSSTYALPSNSETTPTQAPLLIAGNPVQIASNGALVIASQTISQGSQTTISGVTISIGSSALVIDGTTHAFNPAGAAIPTEKSNDQLILTQGEVVIEGSSIITYSGPAVSAFVKDGDIVVGTATLPLGASMTGAAASQGALGGMILSALGNNGPSGSATNSTSGSGSSSQPTVNVVKPSAAVGSVSRGVSVDGALLRLMGLAYIVAMGLMGLVII